MSHLIRSIRSTTRHSFNSYTRSISSTSHIATATPIHAASRIRLHTPSSVKSVKLGASLSSSTQSANVNMGDVKQFVEDKIQGNRVMVFGKSYCPYCHKAKKIIQDATDDYEYIDLDVRDDGSAIQAYLKEKNGQGTVPHVYINQEFIGGCSQLQGIQGKKLDDKIAGKA